MRKFLKWTGIVLLTIIVGFAVIVISRQNRKFDAPYPNVQSTTDSAVIARGKSLVFGPAHCTNCHAPKEMEAAVNRGEEVSLSGGNEFPLPIGTIYTKNLTPDATGIGNMTDAEVARALRYGVRANGNALMDFVYDHGVGTS